MMDIYYSDMQELQGIKGAENRVEPSPEVKDVFFEKSRERHLNWHLKPEDEFSEQKGWERECFTKGNNTEGRNNTSEKLE